MDLELSGPDLPEGLYCNPFHTAVVDRAWREFVGGSERPTIYYPACSADISLLAVRRARVIGADTHLSDEEMTAMAALGLETFKRDANRWSPKDIDASLHIDVVTFFSPNGLNISEVLARAVLRKGGLVVYYSREGLPTAMRPATLQQDFPSLRFAGSLQPTRPDGSGARLDHATYDELYTPVPWDRLNQAERNRFTERIAVYPVSRLKFPRELQQSERTRAIYETLRHNAALAHDIHLRADYRPLRAGDEAALVFRKVS